MPVQGLLALALLGFIAILTETLPAGLLPKIGASLSAGDALTGQLVTAYALGSVVAAIPGAVLTRAWPRRTVLLTAVGGFLAFNSVTAVSTNFQLTLVARFLAGAAAGITWGLVPVYARLMAPRGLEGRAMAVALVGTPLALSLGVPIGTWVGALFGWRLPFIAMSAIALVLVGWILLSVPDFPGNSEKQARSVRQVFTVPGMRPILAVVLTWMLGHNILYTYIEPYLRSIGMASHVAVALLFFGVGALAGIWLVGGLVDQYLRRLVLGSLAVFALIAAILLAAGAAPWLIYPVTLIWGVTFGGAATLLQTASADTAGADADIAQSMIVTGWNAAIAGGGIGGGLLLNLLGPQAFAPAVLLLALVGFLIALSARRHGFPGGGRS
jgi:predicted MFS family arabinose efflux permease